MSNMLTQTSKSKFFKTFNDEVAEAMTRAIVTGDTATMKKHLDKFSKKQINAPLQGSEYFMMRYACEAHQVEAVRMLLSYGCNPNNGVDGDYWPSIASAPPLFTAAESGDAEIVKMLIDAGANPFHQISGRKAKTMAKGEECTTLCREAEAKWLAKRQAAAA